MQTSMLPLLAVALLMWAGVFLFMLAVDRRVRSLEQSLDEKLKGNARR